MHELQIFTDLALIFTVAVVLAMLLAKIRLPPVLAYVAAGALLGPPGLGWVKDGKELQLVAEIGVVLLLFTVGLEFSLSELKRSWKAVLIAGSVQVFGTIAASFGVATAFGYEWKAALVWGFLVSLSSTAVVLRLLDARGESKAAHGRLVIGVLIFQDLCVVPMMLLLPVLGGDGGDLAGVGLVFLKAVVIVGLTIVLSQQVMPKLLKLVARSRNREMFLLAVLAVAGVTAWVTSLTGLSLALGAFLAGIVLADTEYSHQALAEVLPIRAVMMCVFFVTIGMLLDVHLIVERPLAVGSLFGLIVFGKFAMAGIAGLVLRFPVRVAALAGAALAQVGEFSFVLAGHASQHHLLTSEESRLFLAASLLSIAAAPIAVALSPRLLAGSRALRPLERMLDRQVNAPEGVDFNELKNHVIIAGLGVGGRAVVSALESAGVDVVIIELNPNTVDRERQRGRRVVYGDVTAHEVLEHAGVKQARALCLVTSNIEASRFAAHTAREIRPDLPIILRTRFLREEGFERAPGIHVLSEEFAGAASIAGLVLRECGVEHWPDIVESLVSEHDQVPADQEVGLGPPPALHAARKIVK